MTTIADPIRFLRPLFAKAERVVGGVGDGRLIVCNATTLISVPFLGPACDLEALAPKAEINHETELTTTEHRLRKYKQALGAEPARVYAMQLQVWRAACRAFVSRGSVRFEERASFGVRELAIWHVDLGEATVPCEHELRAEVGRVDFVLDKPTTEAVIAYAKAERESVVRVEVGVSTLAEDRSAWTIACGDLLVHGLGTKLRP